MKYIFFGTGDFAVKVLEILCQNGFVPELVVTTPDKPKGRKMELQPSPLKTWSLKHEALSSKILQPEKLGSCQLSACPTARRVVSCQLFIVADYGKIIPKEILKIPKYGSLNVHPSLLPKFRGPSPIQSFILSGEEETGVTIILMDQEVDHGPIVAVQRLEFSISNFQFPKIYYKELEEKLAELGGKLLVETIPQWIDGKIKLQEQNHSQATYTKKISKQDGLIDLNEPAEIIERKVRAYTPWPGAYFFANNKRIIVTKAEIKDNQLVIKRVKPEGKNEMSFEDFLRGNKGISLGNLNR